ncbi:MAG: elongation factor G [Candidatus Eremiobacteraeota bacterium]|nr:elongation factor G [Candidatus Eremiobacteraeota bacterium]
MTDISRVRNIAIVGSHHAGKTSIVESILTHCAAIPRKGAVSDGTATTDYEAECIAHAQSTCVGFAHCRCNDIDLTIVDCPGFVDFLQETKFALSGVDAAVIVVEADPSRVPQTQPLLEFIAARKLPHVFVINKLDRPGSDFYGTLLALREAYGRHVVAEQWPMFAGERFAGVVDLATMQVSAFDGGSAQIPPPLAGAIAAARLELLETMADFDDHLLEELLEGVEPPVIEVERDLCVECSHDQIVPVLGAAGLTGAGIAQLVEAMGKWFPSPADAPPVDAEGRPLSAAADGPVVAHVIKTFVHPQSGKFSVVRVLTGTLRADSILTNMSKDGEKVRSGGLFRLQGKKQEAIPLAGPGSIVAVARLESVATGDTLTTDGYKILLPCVAKSEPVFGVAIKPRDRMDEAKLFAMLARIVDEDPSLRLARAEITNELQILGSGEQHVAIAVERLSRKYKVDVLTAPPQIPYQETITAGTEIHSRYKHQTGGHGQFADVRMRVEARERGHGVTFEERIVGGVVPRQFIPAVERGAREALAHGPLGGYPVTDLHLMLFDGQYHDVDSSEQSFRIAGSTAVREALAKCNPVVLEPIVRVRVTVPTQYTASVIGQLTSKRGQIHGMTPAERSGFEIIEADVPQVEMARYITELRTATQGRGTFTWAHERFDMVPGKPTAPKAAV